jgi:hypothetical protein
MIDSNLAHFRHNELRFGGKTLLEMLKERDCSERLKELNAMLDKCEKDS